MNDGKCSPRSTRCYHSSPRVRPSEEKLLTTNFNYCCCNIRYLSIGMTAFKISGEIPKKISSWRVYLIHAKKYAYKTNNFINYNCCIISTMQVIVRPNAYLINYSSWCWTILRKYKSIKQNICCFHHFSKLICHGCVREKHGLFPSCYVMIAWWCQSTSSYLYMYMYSYIMRETKRDRERQRDTERHREKETSEGEEKREAVRECVCQCEWEERREEW